MLLYGGLERSIYALALIVDVGCEGGGSLKMVVGSGSMPHLCVDVLCNGRGGRKLVVGGDY